MGKDIEIRGPIVGTDISEETEMLILNIADTLGFYTVELENQSNANFTKFFFYTEANVANRIVDATKKADLAQELYNTIMDEVIANAEAWDSI